MSSFNFKDIHILFVVDPWPCNKTTKYNESQCNLTRVSTGGKYTLKRWIMFAILVYPKVPCKKKHLSETFTHVLQFTHASFFWRVTPFFFVWLDRHIEISHPEAWRVLDTTGKILQFRWILEPVIQDLGPKTVVCFTLFWLNKVHLDLIWIFQTALMYTSFLLHSTLVYSQLTCYNRLPTLTPGAPEPPTSWRAALCRTSCGLGISSEHPWESKGCLYPWWCYTHPHSKLWHQFMKAWFFGAWWWLLFFLFVKALNSLGGGNLQTKWP